MSVLACLFFHPFERLPNCDAQESTNRTWCLALKRCYRDGNYESLSRRAGKELSARTHEFLLIFPLRARVLVQLRSSTTRTRRLESWVVLIWHRHITLGGNHSYEQLCQLHHHPFVHTIISCGNGDLDRMHTCLDLRWSKSFARFKPRCYWLVTGTVAAPVAAVSETEVAAAATIFCCSLKGNLLQLPPHTHALTHRCSQAFTAAWSLIPSTSDTQLHLQTNNTWSE